MDANCAVIRGLMLFGLLTLPTVTSDEIVRKSVTSSPVPVPMLWPSNVQDKSPTSDTMRDINNAFNVVDNESKQVKQLISNMFNLNLVNPAYVFRLPQDNGAKRRLVTMQKSDFVQPIFPNLTATYVRLMNSKGIISSEHNRDHFKPTKGDDNLWNLVNPNSLETEDDPALFLNLQTERNFIDYLNEVNQEDEEKPIKGGNSDDGWSLLGLHGWKGELSKPSKGKEDAKHPYKKSNKIPAQSWDLPGRMQKDSLEPNIMEIMKNSSILKIVGNFSQEKYPITKMHVAHTDKDVFIGRVNDPFGHSTKWNVKNSSSNALQDDRKKRAVIELYSMVKCSTGCDPLIYKGYGCYCGFLGDGQPVDGIDQCCRLHDKCYENSNCISYLEYFVPYIWKCYRGKPLCAIDHGEWGGPNSCAARLCQCDLNLSRCLRQFVCPQRRGICRSSKARMLQNVLLNL